MSLLKLYYQPYKLLLYNQFKKQGDAFLTGRKSNEEELWEMAVTEYHAMYTTTQNLTE
jgi:hypothetical protein